MAGFIPPEHKKILVDLSNGRAAPAGYTSTTRYLGLLTGLPEGIVSLSALNGYEVTTSGYARLAVAFNAATETDGIVQGVNTAALTSANMGADMIPAPYAFLTTAASGYTGILLYVWSLAEPVQALSGKPWFVPASGLVVE